MALLFVVLLLAILLTPLLLMGVTFLFGFRLGGATRQEELLRIRMESVQAERQLQDLTREAFLALAHHAEERRRQAGPPTDTV